MHTLNCTEKTRIRFPFKLNGYDFEPNEFPFGSKSKGKLSPRSYPIQCERKRKYSYLSAYILNWSLLKHAVAHTDNHSREKRQQHYLSYLIC